MKSLAVVALLLAAPAAQMAFEVASVKESKSLDAGGGMRLLPGGGIVTQHMPARNLLTIAFQIQGYQLIGAPDWTRNTTYDISAKPAAAATRDQIFPMVQALLLDRFKLSFHREKRQVDGYALVRVRAGELGPSLRPSALDCEQVSATTSRCREGGISANTMKAVGVPLWSVLQVVIGQVGAPVSDETQLTGTYDVELRWSNDVAPSDDLQSIFTAVKEQLGLRLEKRRVMTDVVVVDHIERPGPD